MFQLLEHPLWSFFGTLIGVIGVGAAFLFYLRGRRIKRITFALRRFTIFGENVGTLQGLSVSYGGKPILKLFDYRVLIWNSGSDIIHPSDFASSRPLTIQLEKQCTSVVGVNVLVISSPSNPVTAVMQTDERIDIGFEYLAPKEGLVLSVLSNSELIPLPRLDGLIKGGTVAHFSERRRFLRVIFESLIGSLVMALVTVFVGPVARESGPFAGGVLITVIMVGIALFVVHMTRVLTPRCDSKLRETFGRGFHEWEL